MLLSKMRVSLPCINFKEDAEYCIATDILQLLDYSNPENPNVIGSKVRCIGVANSPFDVKLIHPASQPIPLTKDMIAASQGIGVRVTFSDLELHVYNFIDKTSGKLRQGITATASGMQLLEDKDELIM